MVRSSASDRPNRIDDSPFPRSIVRLTLSGDFPTDQSQCRWALVAIGIVTADLRGGRVIDGFGDRPEHGKGKTLVASFIQRLSEAVRTKENPVLVGLDPRLENLPGPLRDSVTPGDFSATADAFRRFCEEVIDVVAPRVPAVKPQAAFFEQCGPAGMVALGDVIRYAREQGLLVIMDGKRNDIGSTASAYAKAYLGASGQGAWGADALTVSPYLGDDSLQPFVSTAVERDAGIFVLVKTSNPGGGLFQDLVADQRPVYRHVASCVQKLALETRGDGDYGAVGAVVGATYPAQLSELRECMPNCWFLVPGFGAQGAGAGEVKGAFDADGLGAVVNSSRGIIFAYERKEYRDTIASGNWQQAVEASTLSMIEQLRSDTPAGRL